MKKYLSIMWLGLKTTWWKILIVFVATAAIDLFMYDRLVISAIVAGENIPLKEGLATEVLELCWLWGIMVIFLIFRFTGRKGREQERYTIQRLLIKENTFIFLTELYYLLVALVFWALNAGIIYFIGKWHFGVMGKEIYPDFINVISKNEFTQGVIPIGNLPRIIRTIVTFAAFAVGCSEGARRERYCGTGGVDIVIFLVALYYFTEWLTFPSNVHSGWNPLKNDAIFTIIALVYILFCKLRMYREEE